MFKTKTITTLLAFTFILSSIATAQQASQGTVKRASIRASRTVDMGRSYASVLEDVELPSRVAGALIKVDIRKGMQVKANQTVALIDNQMSLMELKFAQAKKQIAEFQANATEPLELAQATYANAAQQLSSAQRLYGTGAGSASELDDARMAATEAKLAVSKSQHDQQVAIRSAALEKMSVAVAQQNLKDFIISSPFDGVVMEVFKSSGEWADSGEKVAKIVRMDKLQVQGSFSANEFNPSEVMGRRVTVTMSIARNQKVAFTGKIYSVSLEQTASRRYHVWAEVENRFEAGQWILRPQAEVKMHAHLE